MKRTLLPLGLLLLLGFVSIGYNEQPSRIRDKSEVQAAVSNDPVTSNQDASTPSKPESEFPFPADRGGKLLAEKLRPANQIPPLANDKLAGPKRRSGPKNIENPDLSPASSTMTAPPSIPSVRLKPIRPALVGENPPLSSERFNLVGPSPVKLPTSPKVAWPSPDVNQPIPLPILARPVTNRASLDDPSGEASQAAALASKVPERTTPAPFLRMTIPDPFEHRNAVRLRTSLPETDLPAVFSILPSR
jgi:hypothetical protein